MECFTQFCVWFLFVCAVSELSWKGWKYYKNRDVLKTFGQSEVSNTESEFVFTIKPKDTKKEELEEEKKNKD